MNAGCGISNGCVEKLACVGASSNTTGCKFLSTHDQRILDILGNLMGEVFLLVASAADNMEGVAFGT